MSTRTDSALSSSGTAGSTMKRPEEVSKTLPNPAEFSCHLVLKVVATNCKVCPVTHMNHFENGAVYRDRFWYMLIVHNFFWPRSRPMHVEESARSINICCRSFSVSAMVTISSTNHTMYELNIYSPLIFMSRPFQYSVLNKPYIAFT